MPAEDQAAQAAAAMATTGVKVVVELTETAIKAISRILDKQIHRLNSEEEPDTRTKQSMKRLQYVAKKQGTTVEQQVLDGLDIDDGRIKQLDKELKKQGVAFSLNKSEDGTCFVSFLASDEQLALNAARRAGIAMNADLVNKVDTPSEKQARANATRFLKPRTTAQKTAEPVFTLDMAKRPYDLRAGIIKENLDRLGIPSVINDEGRLAHISFRQGDAQAVKTMIDSLISDQHVTHFDTDRIRNYDQLEQAAAQEQPVQAQDRQVSRLLEEAERRPHAPARETPELRSGGDPLADRLVADKATASQSQPGKFHLSKGDLREMAKTISENSAAKEAAEQTKDLTRDASQKLTESGPRR